MKKAPKVPAKVVERAKAVAATRPVAKPAPAPSDKKAKLVAALKRLHPMD